VGASTLSYTYFYDGDGNRVQKCNANPCLTGFASGTLYWMSGGRVLDESNRSGTMQEEYIYFNGQRIARRDVATGQVHYYFSDHLGSASVITDSNGNIQQQTDYYPYGGIAYSSGNDPNRYKFTGKERDSESGLDMFGARYYGSSLGRFMTPDWAEKPIDVPYADFGNPQSLNLYSYVKNNPTTTRDLDGHCGWDLCIVEIGIAIEIGTDVIAGAGVIASGGILGAGGGRAPAGYVPGGSLTDSNGNSIFQMSKQGSSSNTQGTQSTQTGQSTPAQPSGNNGTSGGDRAGKPFTPKGKNEVKSANATQNEGQTTCQNCGQSTVPGQQSQSGVTPPGNETHVDHIIPKSQNGDGSPSNGQVLCRTCNLQKSDKIPPQQ
jgi:RHS repeat-associated protein